MIQLPPDFRKDTALYRTFFTWDIIYKCNYRDSYSNFGDALGLDAREPYRPVIFNLFKITTIEGRLFHLCRHQASRKKSKRAFIV